MKNNLATSVLVKGIQVYNTLPENGHCPERYIS